MKLQIFGKSKCFDTKKAQRWFRERGILFQMIDLERYGMSRREYESVKKAVGGFSVLIDEKSKLYDKLYIRYLAEDSAREEALLENPGLFKTPIVRNGKKATVGLQPEIWEQWRTEEQ